MLLHTLGEEILEEFDVETAWRRLQASRKWEKTMESSMESLDAVSISSADDTLLNKKEKHLIWEEIKIKSKTHFTSVNCHLTRS
jgi:hypothetical protein